PVARAPHRARCLGHTAVRGFCGAAARPLAVSGSFTAAVGAAPGASGLLPRPAVSGFPGADSPPRPPSSPSAAEAMTRSSPAGHALTIGRISWALGVRAPSPLAPLLASQLAWRGHELLRRLFLRLGLRRLLDVRVVPTGQEDPEGADHQDAGL